MVNVILASLSYIHAVKVRIATRLAPLICKLRGHDWDPELRPGNWQFCQRCIASRRLDPQLADALRAFNIYRGKQW